MMLEIKEQDVKIEPSGKCSFCASIPLQNLLSAHERLPLRHMAKKLVMEVVNKNNSAQF